MNIGLVFPKSTFLIDPMVYPPLGLFYLASQLENQGHTTEFFDLSEDNLPQDGNFDQVWISATSPQMQEVRNIGKIVGTWKKTRSILGGPAAWANPEKCKNLGYNMIVEGEADYPDAVKIITNNALNLDYPISYETNPPIDLSHVLPPIRRWAKRYYAYLEDKDGNKHRTSTMFTTRGCPMSCLFCESGRLGVIWGNRVRYESLELVTKQLDDIKDDGFTGVMFYDDILPLNKQRTLKILDELSKRNFIWRCFLRTDIITKHGGYEYLKQMRDAGLVEVLAGVESADNQIKNNIFKGTTIEQDTQALLWCKDLGIKFKASIILGLPGETIESMEKTREWILKYRPDRADVNPLIPMTGTPIVKKNKGYDIYWDAETPDEYWYKGKREHLDVIVGTSHLKPQEISNFHDNLIKEMKELGIPY
jgi:anaerobic magnesium-protoporphyrin IX monomethyl ester cyclase